MFNKLFLLFTYGSELEQVLKDIRWKKQIAENERKRDHLHLCSKHQQEENHSQYSEHNCDYCILQEKLNKLVNKD